VTKKYLVRAVLAAVGATSLGLFGALPASASATTSGGGAASGGTTQTPFSGTTQSVCSSAPAGYASCLARIIKPAGEQSHFSYFSHRGSSSGRGGSAAVTVSGLAPTNIKSVYGFSTSTSAGLGKTIALVDAYDDPTAANDLATFSSQWGLPACTTGCFTKVNQTGGSSLPAPDGGWALEISLDIEWAHATAPGAKILLVEANSNGLNDLLTAESFAGTHANYVSNSWGASEFPGEAGLDSYFSGSASYFASTGDSASAVEYPSTSANVVAVGGTSLKFSGNGSLFSSETAWSAGGGGCSADEPAPAQQAAFSQYKQVGCTGRAVPDVSLDADPNSGVAVYDSTPYPGSSNGSNWWTVGGTSVASPIWAAESAVAGISASPKTIYSSASPPTFRDITGGSNGHPTLVGYDLATGRGSWANGASAPPTALAATGSSGQVALTWAAASGATGYDVYRGTVSGGESTTPIATNVSGTTYNDSAVTNGVAYFYEVEGVNSAGAGAPSNQATATPTAGSGGPPPPPNAPAAPTGLLASGSSSGIALTWNVDAGATSYNILRGPSSGAETTLLTGVLSTNYLDAGASPGTTYYYEVVGVNSGGKSPVSNEAHASASQSQSHLTASISKFCQYNWCQFTSTSTDAGGTITTYSWSTSGASGSGTIFSHSFSAGVYSVGLTVLDNKGSSSSASVTVTCGVVKTMWGNFPICT
jgi:hypothetical protein